MERRAIIYSRVSDPSQIENNSLDTQEATCNNFAKAKRYEVVKIFREEGKSAKSVETRPELLQAINYCVKKANRVSCLIVYNFKRFSRNTEKGLAVISWLAKHDVEVVSATEISEINPMGRAMRTVLMAFGQMENEMKGEVVRDNMKAAFRKGLWPFKTPPGYRRKYKTKEENKGLPPVKDEQLSPLIKELFVEASKGLSSKTQLARKLNTFGFEKIYGRKADLKIVDDILKKTFYYGYMYANKWDEYSWGKHEPLIDEETWQKSYVYIFNKKGKYIHQDVEDFPLKGFIKCGECGKMLTTSPSTGRSKKYPYYECRQCCKVRIGHELAHETFTNKYLARLRPNKRVIKLFEQLVFSEWDKTISVAKSQATTLANQIQKLKDEFRSIRKSTDDGLYTIDEGKEEIEKIRQEILVLEVEQSEIKCGQYDTEIVREFTRKFLMNISELWSKLDYTKKQALLGKIFPEGFMCDRNKEFRTVKLSPSFELIQALSKQKGDLVTPLGFEPKLPG